MESFTERLNEIKRIVDQDSHRRRVLTLCQQSDPKSFDEYSSSGSFRRLEKFESSTYSEVLKAVDLADNNRPVVMKIMRALSKGVIKRLPSMATRGCQSYNDILNELVVTQALSQLHDGILLNGRPNAVYRTHFFCLIHEIKVVSGHLDRILSRNARQAATMSSLHVDEEPATRAEANNDANPANQQADTNNAENLATNYDDVKINNADDALKINEQQQIPKVAVNNGNGGGGGGAKDDTKVEGTKIDEDMRSLPEEERMLMESLPHEYVVSVMRHDGQPLWWMMTHKKLTPEQLTSVLVQVIVGLAIAENVYLYEHRDLHVSNILIKRTSNESIPFVLEGQRYKIVSYGVKATIIDATFSRLTHNGRVYFRDLTSTLRAYGTKKTPSKMSLQNRSYRQMVRVTKNKWEEFTPKTNLIWLTYLCETLMKNEIMKSNPKLLAEIKKIRDYTLKVNTTIDLLGYFPFEKDAKPIVRTSRSSSAAQKSVNKSVVSGASYQDNHIDGGI